MGRSSGRAHDRSIAVTSQRERENEDSSMFKKKNNMKKKEEIFVIWLYGKKYRCKENEKELWKVVLLREKTSEGNFRKTLDGKSHD